MEITLLVQLGVDMENLGWVIDMLVKFKRLDDMASIPKYANPGDAGLDLVAISKKFNSNTETVEYDTGLAFEIPEGYVGFLAPRSSICKTGLFLSNSIGILDSGFRASVRAIFRISNPALPIYEVGDRVVQLVIVPAIQADLKEFGELSETKRGFGGFGSTGK